MESPNNSIKSPNRTHPLFRISRRSVAMLRLFRRDEDGTALTELAIMLPVFILIWIGIVNLYKLESGGMRAKITASANTWDKAMDVAYGGHVPNQKEGVPMFAAYDAIDKITRHPSENGDLYAKTKNTQLSHQGTRGEAESAALMARMVGQRPPGRAPGQGLESRYSRDMLDDSRPNIISSAPGPLGLYLPVVMESLASLGFNHTPATGNRYGSVSGEDTQRIVIYGQTHKLSATYDVLNSPVAKPKRTDDAIYVPGFSRLMAEQDPCLKNVLEISTSLGYISNCT